MNYRKGFVVLPILLFIIILGVFGYLAFRKFNPNQQIQSNENSTNNYISPESTNTSTPSLTKPIDTKWQVYTDGKMGFSFKYPEGWEYVKAFGDDYVEFDFKNAKKDTLVFISVHDNNMNIQDAIAEREKEVKSTENYKVAEFKSSMRGDGGSYTAYGEEQNFNFADTGKNLEEMEFLTYEFQEKGLFEKGKKVILHGIVLPGAGSGGLISQMIESFEIR